MFCTSFYKPNKIKLLRPDSHDWADPDSIKILQNVKKAMGPSSKLLIRESLSADDDTYFAHLDQRNLPFRIWYALATASRSRYAFI